MSNACGTSSAQGRETDTRYNKVDNRSSDEEEFGNELDISDGDSVYNSDEEALLYTESPSVINRLSNSHEKEHLTSYENYGDVAGAAVEDSLSLIGARITQEVRNNLAIIIAGEDGGMMCSQLIDRYYRQFGVTLDPYDYGFQSMSQMCEALTDIFHVVRHGKSDWKLYDKNQPVPPQSDIGDYWNEYIKKFHQHPKNEVPIEPFPVEILYEEETVPIEYPADCVPLGFVIEMQEVTIVMKDYLDIIISEIYDPSKYWFQLKSEAQKLDVLMDELQTFYRLNYNEYKLDMRRAQAGLYCAAVILGEYHRGIILKRFDSGLLKIFFIDYGTVSEIKLERVCFLHEQFTILPRQAIRGRLSNIRPIQQNTMWTRTASRRFLELVRDKTLVGFLTHVDYDVSILLFTSCYRKFKLILDNHYSLLTLKFL